MRQNQTDLLSTYFPGLTESSLFTLPYDRIWLLTVWKQFDPGAVEVVGRVKGQLWDQHDSQGSLCISTFSPGYDPTMTCYLSSGPDLAFWIPLAILSVNPSTPQIRTPLFIAVLAYFDNSYCEI